MNESIFRAWVATIANQRELDLEAPENRYSVWSHDGVKPWFMGAFASHDEALIAGRRTHSPSTIYILTGSSGTLVQL